MLCARTFPLPTLSRHQAHPEHDAHLVSMVLIAFKEVGPLAMPVEWRFASNSKSVGCSVVSNSLQPYGLLPARLLCSWDSPGKNTGGGCRGLLQGIFPIQGLNLGLLHCRQTLITEPPGKRQNLARYLHQPSSGSPPTGLSICFLSWKACLHCA